MMRSMVVLLRDVEQLRGRCGHNNLELSRHITELRLENRILKDKYNSLTQELQKAFKTIEDFRGTKHALDSKERQADKLNRQL